MNSRSMDVWYDGSAERPTPNDRLHYDRQDLVVGMHRLTEEIQSGLGPGKHLDDYRNMTKNPAVSVDEEQE